MTVLRNNNPFSLFCVIRIKTKNKQNFLDSFSSKLVQKYLRFPLQ